VILGIGKLDQKLTDVRDDMRDLRMAILFFLQSQALSLHSACPPPGDPSGAQQPPLVANKQTPNP
jgi:hypothetical protein